MTTETNLKQRIKIFIDQIESDSKASDFDNPPYYFQLINTLEALCRLTVPAEYQRTIAWEEFLDLPFFDHLTHAAYPVAEANGATPYTEARALDLISILKGFFEHIRASQTPPQEAIIEAVATCQNQGQLNDLFQSLIYAIDAMLENRQAQFEMQFIQSLIQAGLTHDNPWAIALNIQYTLRLYTLDNASESIRTLKTLVDTDCPRVRTVLGLLYFRKADVHLHLLNADLNKTTFSETGEDKLKQAQAYFKQAAHLDPLARAYYHYLEIHYFAEDPITIDFTTAAISLRQTFSCIAHLEALADLAFCHHQQGMAFYWESSIRIFWKTTFIARSDMHIFDLNEDLVHYAQSLLYAMHSPLGKTFYAQFKAQYLAMCGEVESLPDVIDTFIIQNLEHEYPDTWAVYYEILALIQKHYNPGDIHIQLPYPVSDNIFEPIILNKKTLQTLLIQIQDQFSPTALLAFFNATIANGRNLVTDEPIDLETLESTLMARNYFLSPQGQAFLAITLSINLESNAQRFLGAYLKGSCQPNTAAIVEAAHQIYLYEKHLTPLQFTERMLHLLFHLTQFDVLNYLDKKSILNKCIFKLTTHLKLMPTVRKHIQTTYGNTQWSTQLTHIANMLKTITEIETSESKPKKQKQSDADDQSTDSSQFELSPILHADEPLEPQTLTVGEGDAAVVYMIQPISRDHHCFFTVMGTTRKEALRLLEAQADNPSIRKLLAIDIHQRRMENNTGVTPDFNMKYIPTCEEYLAHLTLYRGDLWVPFERMLDGISLPSLAMAIAAVLEKNLEIYHKHDNDTLELVYRYVHGAICDIVRTIHIDNNHYDGLIPIDKYEQDLYRDPYNYDNFPILANPILNFIGEQLINVTPFKAEILTLSSNTKQLLSMLFAQYFLGLVLKDKLKEPPIDPLLNTIRFVLDEINQIKINNYHLLEATNCFQNHYSFFHHADPLNTFTEQLESKYAQDIPSIARDILRSFVCLNLDFTLKKYLCAFVTSYYPGKTRLIPAITPLSTVLEHITSYMDTLALSEQKTVRGITRPLQ